ncbi:MAG TPA: methylated-DNA--[protein]-cysteine S-methyltransferase, partial [Dehalococcoidia bacterium]|nr:methylated-DNA--[protein]-cysteine S-methyltransferase [Dehalococcoidia bacterium]
LKAEFPQASISADDAGLSPWIALLGRYLAGQAAAIELPLDVRATAFQRQVWQALREIPLGETRTYSQIAALLGAPKAARAVGNACARNPVSIVVPCHRAVREDGGLGGYRWGLERKRALLEREAGGGRGS